MGCLEYHERKMRTVLPDFSIQRRQMVEKQLLPRGIHDRQVIEAMLSVERERFVPEPHLADSYADCALPIGYGQTISQPYIVAYMCQLLNLHPSHRVLEVGCGSGYMAAVLSRIAGKVVSMERIESLYVRAQKVLCRELDAGQIRLVLGDGAKGVAAASPFERIVVSASISSLKPPAALIEQLKTGGIMVCPMGVTEQHIYIFHKKEDGLERYQGLPVTFVPFVSNEQ